MTTHLRADFAAGLATKASEASIENLNWIAQESERIDRLVAQLNEALPKIRFGLSLAPVDPADLEQALRSATPVRAFEADGSGGLQLTVERSGQRLIVDPGILSPQGVEHLRALNERHSSEAAQHIALSPWTSAAHDTGSEQHWTLSGGGSAPALSAWYAAVRDSAPVIERKVATTRAGSLGLRLRSAPARSAILGAGAALGLLIALNLKAPDEIGQIAVSLLMPLVGALIAHCVWQSLTTAALRAAAGQWSAAHDVPATLEVLSLQQTRLDPSPATIRTIEPVLMFDI